MGVILWFQPRPSVFPEGCAEANKSLIQVRLKPIALFYPPLVDLISKAAVSSAVTLRLGGLGFRESSKFITMWQTNTRVGLTVVG